MAAPVKVVAANKYTTVAWVLGPDEEGEAVLLGVGAVKTVQAHGEFEGGTVTIQGSMDGDVWATLNDTGGTPAAMTEAGMLTLQDNPLMIRAISSDTADLDVTVILGMAQVL